MLMLSLDWGSLAVAIAVTVVLAGLGGVLAGSSLRDWFAKLNTPRWQIPFWGFMIAGGIGYLMDIIIFYRLLAFVQDAGARTVALTALLVVMIYNELWNAVLFRLRSTLAAFIGLLGFAAPLAILQVALWVYDPPSGWILLIYSVWFLAYDVPWMYTLWRRNP
jgi:tryptophan-rich sensory protein